MYVCMYVCVCDRLLSGGVGQRLHGGQPVAPFLPAVRHIHRGRETIRCVPNMYVCMSNCMYVYMYGSE